jgi:hypothetical protein
MGESFERTQLWSRTLAVHSDHFAVERARLRTSYLSLRKNVGFVVSRVAAFVPQLTQHEISHLDGLWEAADVIVGDEFPINPLEAYVFGAAVLLHDAGLCPEAYKDGLEGLRSSREWKDAFEFENRKGESDRNVDAADFSTLRVLHARQAAELATCSFWRDPDSKDQMFLIEDVHIRKHLGHLVGQIAASHNWPIEDVQSRFGGQYNAIAEFPRDWRIDPIKIACMLRCADAGHINNSRAPDFLHALLKRTGISFNHWQSQNWLSRIDVDQADHSNQTILLTSTRDFDEANVDSWWVAYDAATVLDKELRSCNSLLESTNRAKFQATHVKGVQSPESMAQFITVRNWTPCAAEVHVGNVETLVRNFGGEKLYGAGQGVDNLQVAIRELFQNSRDAIRARMTFDDTFDPKIVVAVRHELENGTSTTYIEFRDSGVGMSRRTLTGPFLDFGTSFWASTLVHEEFPGLRSSCFRPVGNFGIGFFSVFMVSNHVEVTTRRFDEGLTELKQLKFGNGKILRPVLKTASFSQFPSWCSTKVTLKLKHEISQLVQGGMIPSRHQKSHDDIQVPFSDYLAAIAAGLDVPVFLESENGTSNEIHPGQPIANLDGIKEWLRTITFCKYRPGREIYESYIDLVADRVRPVVEDGRLLGFAALNSFLALDGRQDIFAVQTIGGLACNVHEHGQNFVGFMDCRPQSAKRSATGEFEASAETLKAWAQEQYSILKATSLSLEERLRVGPGLSMFKVDPIDIAIARYVATSGVFILSVDELVEQLKEYDLGIYLSEWSDEYAECYTPVHAVRGMLLLSPVNLGDFNKLVLQDGIPVENLSLIDCIHRSAIRKSQKLCWSILETGVHNSFGRPMKLLRCSLSHDDLASAVSTEVFVW